MKKNRFKPVIITALMLVLLFTSYVAVANEYGSKDDPLVSLSYINEVLMPKALGDVGEVVEDKTKDYLDILDDKIRDFSDEFDVASKDPAFIDKVANKLSNQSISKVLNLDSSNILELAMGSEIIVRSGEGTFTNGFVNVTSGQNTTDGVKAMHNNLYLTAEEGQTFTANSKTTVLVFGTYEIK